jgi:hypothetical protein
MTRSPVFTAACALVLTGCGGGAVRACPDVVPKSGVQVDASAYVTAHHQARRWCVNGLCASARPTAARLVPPNDGAGPVTVTVTVTGRGGATLLSVSRAVFLHRPRTGDPRCRSNALVGGLVVAADGSVTTS